MVIHSNKVNNTLIHLKFYQACHSRNLSRNGCDLHFAYFNLHLLSSGNISIMQQMLTNAPFHIMVTHSNKVNNTLTHRKFCQVFQFPNLSRNGFNAIFICLIFV